MKNKVEPKIYDSLTGFLPDDDTLAKCIHCGMCLAVCPTYDLTKLERSSPRGRIKLIKSVARGELAITETFAEEMNFCLDCQACETACPAGVQYGRMVEAARVEVTNAGFISPLEKKIKKIFLNRILADKKKLKLFAKAMFYYQKKIVSRLLRKSRVLKILGPIFSELEFLSPKFYKETSEQLIPAIATPKREVKHKTAFLTGCLMDVSFPQANVDTVNVLLNNNCQVLTPKGQACCGSLHAHNGEMDAAIELAKKNVDVFSNFEYDYLISNSAGCGAFMKEYGHLLAKDDEYAARATIFSSKVKDITEFLDMIGVNENMDFAGDVTYHDACHLCHTQKVIQQPRNIFSKIKNLNLIPLEESTWCCGSAGVYNILRYDDSMKFLERKMEKIKQTGARTVVTGNPGCQLQIQYGAKKFNTPVEVIHTSTFLMRSYNNFRKKTFLK